MRMPAHWPRRCGAGRRSRSHCVCRNSSGRSDKRRRAAARRLLLIAFRDLTPLRRVEEMRADFVANASHELRTPLASLSGFIDTLRGPARNDPLARDRFLTIMEEQAKRMARLIG